MFYLLLFHMVNITPKAYYANQELPKTSFLVVVSLILLIISYFLVDNNNCKIAANLVRVIKKDTEINLYSALVHQLRNKLPAARLKVMNMIDDLADTDIEVDSFRETLMTTDRILEQVEGQLGAVDKLFTEKVDIFEVCNIRDLFEQHVFPVFESKCYKLNLQCNTNIELPLNKHSFIDAISNLITNAEAHAFDANCHNNNIYFWVKDGKHDTVIDYANDGEPFPRDITKEMFLSYGGKSSASSGQGIGGAYISKMISAHKGRFDIVKDNRFGVYFRITLPKEVNT